jgi:hypothetical protein
VAAIKELLDRGYGKAMQPIQGTVKYGISEQPSYARRTAIRWVRRLRVVRCRHRMASSRPDMARAGTAALMAPVDTIPQQGSGSIYA